MGGLQDIVSLLEKIEMTETIEKLMNKIDSLEFRKRVIPVWVRNRFREALKGV